MTTRARTGVLSADAASVGGYARIWRNATEDADKKTGKHGLGCASMIRAIAMCDGRYVNGAAEQAEKSYRYGMRGTAAGSDDRWIWWAVGGGMRYRERAMAVSVICVTH